MTSDPFSEAFRGCADVSHAAVEGMRQHWRLLVAHNKQTNLTAIVDARQAAWRHYRDSLAAWPLLTGRRVADFGSGAGFPGLVLALLDPRLVVALVEPRRRRAAFLRAATRHLGLANVEVVQGRVEAPPARRFDHAVTRATFSEPGFAAAAAAWLVPGGTLLCYRAAGSAPWGRRHTYIVPGPPPERVVRHVDEVVVRAEAG